MQAVFRLLQDHGLRPVQHRSGNFLTPVGRQAMQHDGRRFRPAELFFVQLVGGHGLQAFGLFLLLSHTRPDVRIERIGILRGLTGVMHNLDSRARAPGFLAAAFDDAGIRLVLRRACDRNVHPHFRPGFDQ